jgi:hypothetical protein
MLLTLKKTKKVKEIISQRLTRLLSKRKQGRSRTKGLATAA